MSIRDIEPKITENDKVNSLLRLMLELYYAKSREPNKNLAIILCGECRGEGKVRGQTFSDLDSLFAPPRECTACKGLGFVIMEKP